MNYYITVLKKYAVFDGRARRAEYWYFVLFNIIIVIVLGIIEVMSGSATLSDQSILVRIYDLAVLIPSIAVGIRRMHDVNKSGWYLLIPLYNLILALTDGTKGDNQYGPDPKAVEVK
jgi:uncharacterized membrane protein YhaH (DUF805 family)